MYIIGSNLISQFVKIASQNFSNNDGRHIETLAFLIGYWDIDNYIATDLIFPNQYGEAHKVEDLGNYIGFKILDCVFSPYSTVPNQSLILFSFILGIENEDSLPWAFETFKTERNKTPILIAWIHSHVRGAECSFSSIDNHTQHAYSKLHREVLGLVIEIQPNGKKGVYDFFELSKLGIEAIERCSRSKNCITTAQHDSCTGRKFYQSAMEKVSFDDFYTLNVSNFISKGTENGQNQPSTDMISEDEMEVENMSENSIDTEENPNVSISPEVRTEPEKNQQANKTDCKYCKKSFVNLFSHISRSGKCRAQYGEEFDTMNKERDDNVKASKRERGRKTYSQNKAKKRKYYNENKDVIRNSQKAYKSRNSERLKEDHRRYNTRNAPIINVSIMKS